MDITSLTAITPCTKYILGSLEQASVLPKEEYLERTSEWLGQQLCAGFDYLGLLIAYELTKYALFS